MKKWIALAMACALMLSSAALAAAWPEGRGPSQPYSGKPEVNLSKTMGYIMRYPRAKWPAKAFCDVLGLPAPRGREPRPGHRPPARDRRGPEEARGALHHRLFR